MPRLPKPPFPQQETVPAFDDGGRFFLERRDRIFENPGGHGGSHGRLMNDFVHSILEDRKPLVDVAQAIRDDERVLRLLEQLADLGIDMDAFYDYYDSGFAERHGLGAGVHFNKAAYGRDVTAIDAFSPYVETEREIAMDAIDSYPLSEDSKADMRRLFDDEVDHLADYDIDEKIRIMLSTPYTDYLRQYVGVTEEVAAYMRDLDPDNENAGYDVTSTEVAWWNELPGTWGIDLGDYLEDEYYEEEPYIFHFPDGNATVARALVQQLIPQSVTSRDVEQLVTARLDYAELDRRAVGCARMWLYGLGLRPGDRVGVLAGNRIEWLAGIINGTGNFILTEMRDKGRDFGEVLAEAQRLGYAEADPTFDVEGIDAAHKLTILASLAFGIPLQFDKCYTEGISKVEPQDVNLAEELGYRIKLLAIAQLTDSGLELHVSPTLVRIGQPLAEVREAYNAVSAVGDAVGRVFFHGLGAGQMPTKSIKKIKYR